MTECRDFNGEPADDLALEVVRATWETSGMPWNVGRPDEFRVYLATDSEPEGIMLARFTDELDACSYAISMSGILAANGRQPMERHAALRADGDQAVSE
jgi:hypothetical protein